MHAWGGPLPAWPLPACLTLGLLVLVVAAPWLGEADEQRIVLDRCARPGAGRLCLGPPVLLSPAGEQALLPKLIILMLDWLQDADASTT